MYDDFDILKELSSYFPPWLLEFKEFKAILSSSALMLDGAVLGLESCIANQIVSKAEEGALRDFEDFLGIKYSLARTNKERQDYISSHFVGNGKFGADKIKNILSMFTGNPFNLRYNSKFVLDIEVFKKDDEDLDLSDCLEILNKRKPAHIVIGLNLVAPFKANIFYKPVISEFKREIISA